MAPGLWGDPGSVDVTAWFFLLRWCLGDRRLAEGSAGVPTVAGVSCATVGVLGVAVPPRLGRASRSSCAGFGVERALMTGGGRTASLALTRLSRAVKAWSEAVRSSEGEPSWASCERRERRALRRHCGTVTEV